MAALSVREVREGGVGVGGGGQTRRDLVKGASWGRGWPGAPARIPQLDTRDVVTVALGVLELGAGLDLP